MATKSWTGIRKEKNGSICLHPIPFLGLTSLNESAVNKDRSQKFDEHFLSARFPNFRRLPIDLINPTILTLLTLELTPRCYFPDKLWHLTMATKIAINNAYGLGLVVGIDGIITTV